MTRMLADVKLCRSVLGLAFVLAACDKSAEPTAPAGAVNANLQSPLGLQQFYYHQGEPVYLDVVPGYLIVNTDDGNPAVSARAALSRLGMNVNDAGDLPQAGRHRLLKLEGATAADQTRRAAEALRTVAAFRFVSETFRTRVGSHLFRPLNRFDVLFKADVTPVQVDSLLSAIGARLLRTPRPDSGFFAYRVEYPPGANPLAIAETLYRHPLVQWTAPDATSDRAIATVPTDPYFGQQFNLTNPITRGGIPVDINVIQAWNLTLGSSSIRVAVIDDGIDILQGNSGGGSQGDIIGNWGGAAGYDLLWDPSRSEDAFHPCCNDAHGTAIAGIIAATHNSTGGAGIAPNVILNSVRIFRRTYPPESNNGATEVASDLQIADGINWAWQFAASDILSNSWGGGAPSEAITNAIHNALTQGRAGKGAVVVFAAGNTSDRDNGSVGAVEYPAYLSGSIGGPANVIAVGAINRFGEVTNYTPGTGKVDVVAPSGHYSNPCVGEIITTDRYGTPGCNDGPTGDANYTATFSGTSAAAPQVSGVAALLLSYSPGLTASQVKARIRGGARYWGSSKAFGAGKLDAYRTLVPPLPPPPPPVYSVVISGPTEISPTAVCSWVAAIDNGTPPYSYEWRRDGVLVSTTDSYSGSMSGAASFQLQLTATDGAFNTDSDQLTVTNTGFGECLAF